MAFSWSLSEQSFLTLKKVKRLRRYCGKHKDEALKATDYLPVRNWFMIELGLNTGLRVQEMSDLKAGDLLISGEESSLIVRRGKGGKKRTVWLNKDFKDTCRSFLQWKQKYSHAVDEQAPVLTTEMGRQLTKRTLQNDFKRIANAAGLESHYSIHCLRHTYATHLLKASGNNFKLIKEQLGHSSIKVSEIYAGLIGNDVKKAIEKIYRG